MTPENVATVFKTGILTNKDFSFRALGIPKDHLNNPLTAAQWWLKNGKNRSWRYIIYSLDKVGATRIADQLMPYSESPSGM